MKILQTKNFFIAIFVFALFIFVGPALNKAEAAGCSTDQANFCSDFQLNSTAISCNSTGGDAFTCQSTNQTGNPRGDQLINSGAHFPGTKAVMTCAKNASGKQYNCNGTFSTSTDLKSSATSPATPPSTGGSGGSTAPATGGTSGGSSGTTSNNSSKIIESPTPGITSIGDLLNKFLGFIPVVIGLLVLVFIFIGGFKILTAGADDQKRAEGIKVITNALIGVVVVVMSVSIIIFVQALLGAQILFGLIK